MLRGELFDLKPSRVLSDWDRVPVGELVGDGEFFIQHRGDDEVLTFAQSSRNCFSPEGSACEFYRFVAIGLADNDFKERVRPFVAGFPEVEHNQVFGGELSPLPRGEFCGRGLGGGGHRQRFNPFSDTPAFAVITASLTLRIAALRSALGGTFIRITFAKWRAASRSVSNFGPVEGFGGWYLKI